MVLFWRTISFDDGPEKGLPGSYKRQPLIAYRIGSYVAQFQCIAIMGTYLDIASLHHKLFVCSALATKKGFLIMKCKTISIMIKLKVLKTFVQFAAVACV